MEYFKKLFGFKKEEPNLGFGQRLRVTLAVHWRGLVCFLTPIIASAVVLPFPAQKYQWCGYTLIIMAAYWVTECIALPVTAFFPVAIFSATQVMTTEQAAKCYFDDTIIMFLGSLFLAASVEQSGLHVRLALASIRCIGYSHRKLLFAMTSVTTFVSLWITNTAATTMMVPIVFALLQVFEDNKLLKIYTINEDGERTAAPLTVCYFCCCAYSSSIGGVGTLVGTGTNLVFKGLFVNTFRNAPDLLSFPRFCAFGFPKSVAMAMAMYLGLSVQFLGLFRPNSEAAKRAKLSPEGLKAAKEAVNKSWKELGPMTFWEIMVVILFTGAMACFFSRSPMIFKGWGDLVISSFSLKDKKFIKDSCCAMFFSCAMFFVPSNLNFFKNWSVNTRRKLPHRVPSCLRWRTVNAAMPWSFTFLLGGGFCISTGAKPQFSNLNGKIGDFLSNLKGLPTPIIVLVIIVFTVFVTNFASNVAVATVIVPIVQTLAINIHQNPLLFNISAGFSASYCFMLPVGTPPNLIVQSAAKIATPDMVKAGAFTTLAVIFITWFFILAWSPIVWPETKAAEPTWIH